MQAKEEAEDAALLVDYTGSIAKGKCPSSQLGTTNQPSPLPPPAPAPHLQHAQPVPKQLHSRKGGHRQSWANPSRFSTGSGKASSAQLLSAVQLDNQDSAPAAMLSSKHGGGQHGGSILKFDIDDDDDDGLASMPSQQSDRQQGGSTLKFDIDDDDDDDTGPLPISSRKHSGRMPKFDIDDDNDDDDDTSPVSAPMLGRQHGRQHSTSVCKSDTHHADDAMQVHHLSEPPSDPLGHGHGHEQEMRSAPPNNFDIDDSEDDNIAGEAANDLMDEGPDARRGEIHEATFTFMYVTCPVHSCLGLDRDWNLRKMEINWPACHHLRHQSSSSTNSSRKQRQLATD